MYDCHFVSVQGYIDNIQWMKDTVSWKAGKCVQADDSTAFENKNWNSLEIRPGN